MTRSYLDTSAAMKLLVDEPESDALVHHLVERRRILSSWLLHTELHCAAGRHPYDIEQSAAQLVLDTVDLVDITRGDLLTAGTLTPLRSHDAIHLATSLRLSVDEMITYDSELAAAAEAAGLVVIRPGSTD